MHTKSISGTVTSTVTLGAGGYGSHLTITATGAVEPASYGAVAIVVPETLARQASILNEGLVVGGVGSAAPQGIGGDGGIGIDLAGYGVVRNQGSVAGGAGGLGASGGSGGAGVIFVGGGRLSNTGTVAGGMGQAAGTATGVAGTGGIGVELAFGSSLSNSMLISGGSGGNSLATTRCERQWRRRPAVGFLGGGL